MRKSGRIRAGRANRGASLQEFQQALSKRIGAAASVVQKDLRLGIRVASQDWLLALPDAGEVIPVPAITPVPRTKPWMLGLANVRGRLHAVTDLAAFFGETPTPVDPRSRLLLVGQRHGSNAAILVDRVLGLKSVAELSPLPSEEDEWVVKEYSDPDDSIGASLPCPDYCLRTLFARPPLEGIRYQSIVKDRIN